MITSAITPEIAREMQAKGVLARKRNQELRRLAAIGATVTNVEPVKDPYVDELMRAQEETLAELRSAESAKDKASLAQALKNLRETYHLATGLAKPGVLKPTSKPRQQAQHDFPDAPSSE